MAISNENKQTICKIIIEQFGLLPDTFKLDARFEQDFGGDSLDILELAMDLEERFNIEISDEETEDIKTVQGVIDLIERKLEE